MHPLVTQHLFPHAEFRPQQAKFVAAVGASIRAGKSIMVQAPTGSGKTAATVGPAVSYALEHKKTVFFLTGRRTQHQIAVRTLKDLQETHKKQFGVLDIVGKQQLCLQPGVTMLSAGEFGSYCKHVREHRTCEYYVNTRKHGGQLDIDGRLCHDELERKLIPVETLKSAGERHKVCPYEIAVELAKTTTVIIGDYSHLFNQSIRHSLLSRTQLDLSDCIIIVNEAHNLPHRIKDQASAKITSRSLQAAHKEAQKANEPKITALLWEIGSILERFNDEKELEMLVEKKIIDDIVDNAGGSESVISMLQKAADKVREEKRSSSLGGLAEFLHIWETQRRGYSRILTKGEGQQVQLKMACLDAGVVSEPVFANAHSVICMSGTLHPLEMYRDVLAAPKDTTLLALDNPFPKENKLNLAITDVSTKFTSRNEVMFEKIRTHITRILETVQGNIIVFFPSYKLMNIVGKEIAFNTTKPVIIEQQHASHQERTEQLKSFKQHANLAGSAFFAVSAGSFGEGVDLPGNLLSAVIVVGVPLKKPTLEQQQIIDFYQLKYGKGWDYGYLIPAFNIAVQNAGRCIRTETDKGVIVYMDARYGGQFSRFFQETAPIVATDNYIERIDDFFSNKQLL